MITKEDIEDIFLPFSDRGKVEILPYDGMTGVNGEFINGGWIKNVLPYRFEIKVYNIDVIEEIRKQLILSKKRYPPFTYKTSIIKNNYIRIIMTLQTG